MSDTGKDKITIRVSGDILNRIDEHVNSSKEFKTRSDFIREIIKKEGCNQGGRHGTCNG